MWHIDYCSSHYFRSQYFVRNYNIFVYFMCAPYLLHIILLVNNVCVKIFIDLGGMKILTTKNFVNYGIYRTCSNYLNILIT